MVLVSPHTSARFVAFITSLMVCSAAESNTPCRPKEFSWLASVARWTKAGHNLQDIDSLRSLVQKGYISEVQARNVVDEFNVSPVNALYHNEQIAESETVHALNHVVNAFGEPMHGQRFGEAKPIKVGKPTRADQRRTHVLLQNSTPNENEDAMSFVLLDPNSRRVLASTEYDFDSKHNTLNITWIGVYKLDRGQGYSDLIFQQLLARFPQTRKIVTTFGGDNLKIFEKAIKEGKSREEAMTLTPAYKSRMKLGFKKMSVDIDEWGSPELTATRP